MKSKSEADSSWPRGWDEHRVAQIRRIARETTPAQRLKWIEEMLIFMNKTGESYLERKHKARSTFE